MGKRINSFNTGVGVNNKMKAVIVLLCLAVVATATQLLRDEDELELAMAESQLVESAEELPAVKNCNKNGCCSCHRVGGRILGKCRPKGPGCHHRTSYCQCRSRLHVCYGVCTRYQYGN